MVVISVFVNLLVLGHLLAPALGLALIRSSQIFSHPVYVVFALLLPLPPFRNSDPKSHKSAGNSFSSPLVYGSDMISTCFFFIVVCGAPSGGSRRAQVGAFRISRVVGTRFPEQAKNPTISSSRK